MHMFTLHSEPLTIATEMGLLQQSDEGFLKDVAERVIASNPAAVAEYQTGKVASLQFLLGQGMRETKGSANPEALKNAFITILA